MLSEFMGMKVIVDHSLDDVPRMQLSPKFAANMPEQFVAETNAWMIEFFGRENRCYYLHGNTLVIGPKSYRAMQESA